MSEAPQQTAPDPDAVGGFLDLAVPETQLLHAATDPRRRATLGVLRERGELPLRDLATHVAARERSVTVADVSPSLRDRVAATLHHTHVPKLREAGLVTTEAVATESFVTPTGWVSDGRAFDAIEAAFDTGDTDEVVATLLADEDRRRAVAALRTMEGPVALADLAEALAEGAADGAADGTTPAEGATTATTVSLHHSHLPKLDDAGVVDYDRSARVVEFRSVPDVYDALTTRE
jgi:DNA-binding transcriptional ArsR family regulator